MPGGEAFAVEGVGDRCANKINGASKANASAEMNIFEVFTSLLE